MSARILILADDLTGANDSAAQFAAFDARAVTFLSEARPEQLAALRDCFQVLSLSTESRNMRGGEAADAVSRVLAPGMAGFVPDVVFKKIDSTLRGNIQAEVQTCARLAGYGKSVPVILTPAYPSNGRTVCGGYVLVNGVPLSRTFAGRDTLAPVNTSRVSDIFPAWGKRTGELHLSSFEDGEDGLRRALLGLQGAGKNLILADTLDQEDMNMLVRVATSSFRQILWVGSAGLARALAGYLARPAAELAPRRSAGHSGGRVLILYGSLNPASEAQVDYVRDQGSCQVIYAPSSLNSEETYSVLPGLQGNVAVTSAHVTPGGPPEEAAARVKTYFEGLARKAIASDRYSSMVLAGGDIARAVLAALGASAVTVEAEILPGVAYSRVCDGLAAGIGVVTKAGGFGGSDTLSRVLSWLNA